ncbi:MAG: YaiI/YqxD family protein [Sarcina sp.]
MRIIIDGDGCAGKGIIESVAKKYNLPVIIYCDIHHRISSNYSTVKIVDDGFQSVDMYVINECKGNDIVVTQDYGVAAMSLGKKAFSISPKGYIYTNENIDRLLFERHLNQKARKAGLKGKNPSKRSREDDYRLATNLKKIIEDMKKSQG